MATRNCSYKSLHDRHQSIPEYRAQKIKMLTEDFCLKLSVEEVNHFHNLATEADIDQYAHDLIKEKL